MVLSCCNCAYTDVTFDSFTVKSKESSLHVGFNTTQVEWAGVIMACSNGLSWQQTIARTVSEGRTPFTLPAHAALSGNFNFLKQLSTEEFK